MQTRFTNLLLLALLLSIGTLSARAEGMSQPDDQKPTNATVKIGRYANSKVQVISSYVNKSWICSYEGHGTQREDFYGDPDAQFLHGWQLGTLYTPAFNWGLGLRTGLVFEWYISHSKWIRDWSTRFSELDLYIPVQAMYRYTGNKDFGVEIFGGFSFQLAMAGLYFQYYETAEAIGWPSYYWYRPCGSATKKQSFGNGWPERINWQADIGFNFRYQMIGLGFTYSFGLNDQGIQTSFNKGKSFVTATKSREDKMQVTFTIFI